MSSSSAVQKPIDAMPLNTALLSTPPAGVETPKYNRAALKEGIVHLGVGGFHRSHQALYLDELIGQHGCTEWAICGVGIMPTDAAMNKAMTAQDGLYTLVERSGTVDSARVIGSLTRHIFGYENPEQVFQALAQPSVKIVTLTATEGGYCFNQGTGEFDPTHPGILNDLQNPKRPRTIFGYLAEGLERRKQQGLPPFTVLSCDNLQGNGHIARKMLLEFCKLRNKELATWIEKNVAFPNSMVDRITPMTTDADRQMVRETYGIADECPVVSESFRQWVIEDHFSNGRPPFEKVGIQMTDDVAPYEKMKLRLLNATHSAMGYLGYLCGFRYIYEVAGSKEYLPYVRKMMDEEVTPVVPQVPGVNLTDYKKSVLERFANPHIKDQVLRICMDGSAKMPKFIMPSITDQLAKGGPIKALTLCVASWMRFLNGVDEEGKEIPINDPMADRLRTAAQKGKEDPAALLALTDIFGELSTNQRFISELKPLLESLYKEGGWKTLKKCL